MLAEALRAAGLSVVQSKEPTDGPYGQQIKQSAAQGRMSAPDELAAFTADRREHVRDLIQPALDRGDIVVLDRYYYSTLAYQGSAGSDVDAIRSDTESFAPVPDAVFLLDVDPALGIFRISESRGERPNEFETIENLQRVRSTFLSLSDSNIIRVDGSPSQEIVHAEIVTRFVEGPLKQKYCAKSYGCDDPMHCTPRFTGQCEWWNLRPRFNTALTPSSTS